MASDRPRRDAARAEGRMRRWIRRGALVVGCAGVLAAVLVGAALAYVTSADPRHDDVPEPAIRASADPAVIERGAYLVYAVAHCSECHGARPAGDHSPKAG